MPFDEKTAQRVREVLADQRDLIEKRMMGGLCFMLAGHMCCGVTGSALMVRVGRDKYEQAIALPNVRPLEFAGRRPGGFVLIDPAGHRTKADLMKWIEHGIDFVATLPPKSATKQETRARARHRKPSAQN